MTRVLIQALSNHLLGIIALDAVRLLHVFASYRPVSFTRCRFIQSSDLPLLTAVDIMPRGHVNKKKFQKSKKTLEVGGQVSNWKYKKIGKYIFIHYFITFLGEHSNVDNVINALLCLCSCFYAQVFVVNYFLDFPEFFFF